MKQTSVVIGLGFGDEGKGITTDYLSKNQKNSLIIRFSGGQQAGHTVIDSKGNKHVFSNFGSGTFNGVPSYWSNYCTISPIGIFNEYTALRDMGFTPTLYIDNQSMITTPYDIAYNRTLETINNHGSCGMGFAATIQRSDTKIYALLAQDILLPPRLLQWKLNNVAQYYENMIEKLEQERKIACKKIYHKHLSSLNPGNFVNQLYQITNLIKITEESILQKYDSLIFEGSQGVLLDMDYGFFPHVTRSNTISKNALEIIKRNKLPKPVIYYITRSYLTRHGNGPMLNEHYELPLQNTEEETNVLNDWQGDFRTSPLDLDLINYALQCDSTYTNNCTKRLVVTCLDQLVDELLVTKSNKEIRGKSFSELINDGHIPSLFDQLIESHSPCSDDFVVKKLGIICYCFMNEFPRDICSRESFVV